MCEKQFMHLHIAFHVTDQFPDIHERLLPCVFTFQTQNISNLYDKGFISMWKSNHWILMYFYLHYGSQYEGIWSLEYDVRMSGPFEFVFDAHDYDFVYVAGNRIARSKIEYSGSRCTDFYTAFLQISYYSSRFLQFLHTCFQEGESAVDEIILPSLCVAGQFSMSSIPLHRHVRGKWTWNAQYSNYNEAKWHYYAQHHAHTIALFHPIKN